ncbi:hypothetical protein MTP99_015288 [Tenebrio molitor]|nr:hypothetical protein MTP99_015288 [Tenebrio molitor]
MMEPIHEDSITIDEKPLGNKPFILEQSEIREDYDIKTKTSQIHIILHKSSTRGVFSLLVFAIVVPVLVYYFLIDKGPVETDDGKTCSVTNTYRITCGSRPGNFSYCTSIQCCYDNTTKLCYHYVPSKYYYFNSEPTEKEVVYQRSLEQSPFGKQLTQNIAVSVDEIDENNVRIVLHDPAATVEKNTVAAKNYYWEVTSDPLFVEVFRGNDTQDILLTTAKGPTIISDKYWEWSFQMTDEYLFGLGQVLIDLDENSTLTKVVYGNGMDHSTLPVFMAYKNGNYHGLIVRNSGPLEVTVLPSNLVSLKSLAGDRIVLELSVGPTPRDVIKQQKKGEVGGVDLWTLGVHLCREGSDLKLRYLLDDYNGDSGKTFRYESDCLHENLVTALRYENEAEDVDEMLQTITKMTTEEGRRFMLSLPPQVPFNSAFYNATKDLDVYFKSKDDDYQGLYFNTSVVYPYFKHAAINDYTQRLLEEMKSYFPDQLPDVLLLNHNWPLDESFQMRSSKNFQYLSEGLIQAMSLTLPWNVTSDDRLQILDHNDYGALQVENVVSIFGQDSFIMTASHNADTLQPVMIQNVTISWVNFKNAIASTLYNSIFGHPLVGFPVCGSTRNFTESSHDSLCMRWYLMASTSPIFRISSDTPRRDPEAFLSQTVTNTALDAITLRYKLRYYFYTILNSGEPLMRPMFYDFPNDNNTFNLVEQYAVGDILVKHPTLPSQTQLKIYLPKSVKVWYEFWGGDAYDLSSTNETEITLTIAETDWIAFIPEGTIIPLVDESDTNKTLVQLKVGLKCDNQSSCEASGSLMIGTDLFMFNSTETDLTIQREKNAGYDEQVIYELNQVEIFHLNNTQKLAAFSQNLAEIESSWSSPYN